MRATLAVCKLILCLAPAPLAPAPEPVAHDLAGVWTMDYGDGTGQVLMCECGVWYDRWGKDLWVGRWAIAGDWLYVTESVRGYECTWRAKLDKPRRGKVGCTGVLDGSGATFRLRR